MGLPLVTTLHETLQPSAGCRQGTGSHQTASIALLELQYIAGNPVVPEPAMEVLGHEKKPDARYTGVVRLRNDYQRFCAE